MKEPKMVKDLPDIYEEVLKKLGVQIHSQMLNFMNENNEIDTHILINCISMSLSDVIGCIYSQAECTQEELVEDLQQLCKTIILNCLSSFQSFKETGTGLFPPLK